MARQPTVGGDSGTWGTTLNDYLSVSLDAVGAVKNFWVNVKAPPYNAVGNGVADDTTAIQAALDAAKGDLTTNVVFFPPGNYLVSQLRFYKGQILLGSGMGASPQRGTMITQKDGVNESCITNDPTNIISTDYAHWVKIANMYIAKTAGSDTLGSGIDFACRTGEGTVISDVYVNGFPEHGIRLQHGGAPGRLREIHVFNNGAYGLSVERGAGDTWQSFECDAISGDNNTSALFRILLAGDAREQFLFKSIKAETSAASKQPYIGVFDNTNGAPITIMGIGALADNGQTGTAVFRITNSNAKLTILGNAANNFTNLIQDDVNSKSYATFGEGLVIWRAGVPYKLPLSGTAAWDPPALAPNAVGTATISVSGAKATDIAAVSFSNALNDGMFLTGCVNTANLVKVMLYNLTAGTVNLAAGTLTANVWQH